MVLFNNLKEIYRKMSVAAMKAERCPSEVRLIAVTKGVGADTIMKGVESGLREFGESRLPAAYDKIMQLSPRLTGSKIVWHLIGHLQKNKAKTAVGLFDLIHSVDSLELAEVIDRHAGGTGKVQKVLVQVKLSDEESKYGISREKVPEMLERMSVMKNLDVTGLMTIPPFFEDPEMARPYFTELRKIREAAEESGFSLPELSMGMSNDFEVAIEEGATMVRVGTAIFGEREKEEK
jgi:hypothetical protein